MEQYFKKTYKDQKISNFPINREIEAFLQVKSNTLCEIHEKQLEYFCYDDETDICQICIIFGKHKSHNYTLKRDLKKNNEERFDKI